MRVPHNAVVVVADGRKMLFLRNEGDALHPNLQVERAEEISNPDTREQGTDRPGRGHSSAGAGSSAYAETDWHQLEEDRFAAETAAMLKDRALRQEFESLIIVAPPRTLGELRKHYHKEVTARLAGELDKDLTGHTIPDIEKALVAAQ